MKVRVARVLASLPAEKRARLRAALSDVQDALEAMTKEQTNVR